MHSEEFLIVIAARMPFAEALMTPGSTIDPSDDPMLNPATRSSEIASHQNALLWNQRLSRKLLITLDTAQTGLYTLIPVQSPKQLDSPNNDTPDNDTPHHDTPQTMSSGTGPKVR